MSRKNDAGALFGRQVLALLTGLMLLLGVALPAAAAPSQVLLRVTDTLGQPVGGASVEAYELNKGLVALEQSGVDGIIRLPFQSGPGSLWLVRVSAQGYQVRETGWFDPAQGGVRSVRLESVGGDLQLYIRDAAGDRVNADVTLLTAGGGLVAQGKATGGRWVSQALPAGEYRALVSAPGQAQAERRLVVTAGRVAVESINLAPGNLTVMGEVVDSATLAPIKGARVELLRNDEVVVAEGFSAANGRIRMEAQTAGGSYRLRVSAAGYSPTITAPQTAESGGYVDLTGHQRIRLVSASATVEGSLVTAGSRSIPWAEVVLMREGFGEVARTTVTAEGTFRFEGVAAGAGFRYQLVADKAIDNVTVDWIDLAISDWFQVNPGGKVAITLVAQNWNRQALLQSVLTGVVLGPTGLPIEGATVELIRRTKVDRTATTDAEGRFAFDHVDASEQDGLIQAPYMLRISKEGFVSTREVTVAGQQRTTFGLPAYGRLTAAATIRPEVTELKGRVVDRYGRPVTGAQVALSLGDGSSRVLDRTDNQGWYRLANVPTNTAWASLQVTAAGYLPAAEVDLAPILSSGDAPPTVQLTPRTSTFDGVVIDLQGKPVGGATVKVWQDGKVAAEAVVESDGYYTAKADLTTAALGLITVEREGYSQGGLVLSQLPAPGQRVSQPLLLQQEKAVLEGRVVDTAGNPVVGVRVEMVIEGKAIPVSVLTGADGRYRFEQALASGSAWTWLRARPASGTFAGSLTHGMDLVPITRLSAGERTSVDLLIKP